ncbi:SDR family oxidoreductase [Thalassospira povalilytica]|uniref:SDR family oxidoreductase n=1 Tax=Thalassospira povalilytica TaxID=732237 RepID=A0A8I1SIT0_9PROT|nr:SDR family oxidoreductase [Thalassospira povalilytica]MBN8195910.1 SDR family oxidoreductase [Thalassospira povalilytica]
MTSHSGFDVAGEIVVVTGAGGQLGSAYARAFLECGASVWGLDIVNNSAISKLEEEYPSLFKFRQANITIKTDLKKIAQEMTDSASLPTVLLNNAALDSPPKAPAEENGPFEEYPESSWDEVLDVNLKGMFLCCQVFGRLMAQKRNGSIINVSSIYGVVAPDQSLYEYRRKRGENFYKPIAYSVSKSGVLNLSRYLAAYWAKSNVRVNTLTISGVFNNQEQEFLEQYCSRIPVGRMALPSDYCGPVLFLASAASGYMTGSNLVVDGGWTAI